MAYKAPEHGLVSTTCETNGGDILLTEVLEVIAVDDFVLAVVREVGLEVSETYEGVVDGFGRLVDEVKGFFWRWSFCLSFCCHSSAGLLEYERKKERDVCEIVDCLRVQLGIHLNKNLYEKEKELSS